MTLSACRRAEPASCTCVPGAARSRRPRGERLAELDRPRQEDATRARAPRRRAAPASLERLQHALLELRAEAAHGAQALGQRRLAQRLERVDPELVVKQPRALGAEARAGG